jgi:hypothetical protein
MKRERMLKASILRCFRITRIVAIAIFLPAGAMAGITVSTSSSCTSLANEGYPLDTFKLAYVGSSSQTSTSSSVYVVAIYSAGSVSAPSGVAGCAIDTTYLMNDTPSAATGQYSTPNPNYIPDLLSPKTPVIQQHYVPSTSPRYLPHNSNVVNGVRG